VPTFRSFLLPVIIIASLGASACDGSAPAGAPGSDCDGGANGGASGGVITSFISSLVPDRVSGSAVYVNHPISVTFGAVSQGVAKDVMVTLGLMEKPAPDATDADLQNLHSCILQGAEVHLRGDGTEQFTQFNAVVPPECLDGGPERTFNFQLIVDLVEDVTGQDPAQKILVFNERDQNNPINQKCHIVDPATGADTTGCAVDLVVKPSPGLNVALTSAQPSTSVVVAYPPAPDPAVPAGQAEAPRGALAVKTELRAYGQSDEDVGAGVLPAPINLTYEVEAQPDDTNVGFRPLGVNVDSVLAPITTLRPGQVVTSNANLALPDETRALLAPGGAWYGADNFLIRVCAAVPFAEHGDPVSAGTDGRLDDCKLFPIRLVIASSPPSFANAYDADKDYGVTWGSKSSVEATFTAYSHNDLDLSGATADQKVALGIDGLFGRFTAFEAWATASSTVTPALASLDTGVTLMGSKLFGYGASGGAITYGRDINFSKEYCQRYVFAALIVPVEVAFCISGSAGIAETMTLTPTSLTPAVRPYASLDASASASLGDAGFRASVVCDATVLGVNPSPNDGGSATLTLAPSSTVPQGLDMSLDVAADLSISTLDIDFRLVLEAQEPDICKKKVAGVKIKYPCFKWNTVENYTIATFNGFSYPYSLLHRKYAATLQ
jgi:hypothetical protein